MKNRNRTLLTIILLLASVLVVYAASYDIIQTLSGMQQGHKFSREVWGTLNTYIKMPNVSNWESANNDIYIYSIATPSGEFWRPTPEDNIAKDYLLAD